MPLPHPAEDEEGGSGLVAGEEVQQARNGVLYAGHETVPIRAPHVGRERRDLKVLLDVDGEMMRSHGIAPSATVVPGNRSSRPEGILKRRACELALAGHEWQRLLRYEQGGDTSPTEESQRLLRLFYEPHAELGFSTWNLYEALCRFWDVHIIGPPKLLLQHAALPSLPDRSSQSVDLYRSRFGVPLGFPVITPVVALVMIQSATTSDGASPKVAL